MTVTLEVGEAREETGRGPGSTSGPLMSQPEASEEDHDCHPGREVWVVSQSQARSRGQFSTPERGSV